MLENPNFRLVRKSLILRRPIGKRVYVPVVPDLAQTVKVKSDHFEKFTKFFCGSKNGYFIEKFIYT